MNRGLVVAVASLLLGCFVSIAETDAKPQSKAKSVAKKESKKKDKKEKSDRKDSIKRGKKIFQSHCASCHAGGGNIVKPSKSIRGSGTLATFATFKANLNIPIGNMPHYEHLITDEEMLQDLYKYTKTFEDNGSDEKAPDKKAEKKAKPKSKSKPKKK